MPDSVMWVAIGVLLAVLVLRNCRDGQRIVVTRGANFMGLRGPGLYLKAPTLFTRRSYTPIGLGDAGTYTGNGWARIKGLDVPVNASETLDSDARVEVRGFVDGCIFVAVGP